MDKWCETIVWREYPKHKPEKDGWYFTLSDESGVSYMRFLSDEWEHEKFFVTAFAELPTGEISDEFGFETAMMLMMEDRNCVSMYSQNVWRIANKLHPDAKHFELLDHQDDSMWRPNKPSLSEIQGKWRLA